MYVPQPIGIRPAHPARSARDIGAETLALTKMNWNQTRLDGRDPVTLRTANQVKAILRFCALDQAIATRTTCSAPAVQQLLAGPFSGRRVIGAGSRELGVL